ASNGPCAGTLMESGFRFMPGARPGGPNAAVRPGRVRRHERDAGAARHEDRRNPAVRVGP
ncbi:MAG: hypothetical protein OXD29_15195, partial [Roseovarius sp.]|nr:hypothetical protein [Roseovarius sp.]